ncbi:hypothetical protein GLOIN_2v1480811 [Rhizophagus clarus]|uniref:Uncharacterized protein n=1 Tax=Rhizophagus clarus TaxID=94130 RepID=A0A8H3KXG4_9GLOM|nr:hypothetical protein GLOIN_2v1480811 [Rhizophagus clarus]
MARSDKKNRECICCRKAFSTPQKLRQHYTSTKNQCSLPSINNQPTEPRSPSFIPALPTPKPDGKYIDKYARKPGEHMKTWSARLHRRWVEIAGEKCDLPQNLKECQRLYQDILQADDEALELQPTTQDEDQVGEAGPGPTTQANALAPPVREELTSIDKINQQVDDYELLKELGMIEETEIEKSLGNWKGLKEVGKVEDHTPEGDLHFEEEEDGDPSRPYRNLSALSK